MLVGAGNGKSSAVSLRMGSERSAEDLPPEWQWAFRERLRALGISKPVCCDLFIVEKVR